MLLIEHKVTKLFWIRLPFSTYWFKNKKVSSYPSLVFTTYSIEMSKSNISIYCLYIGRGTNLWYSWVHLASHSFPMLGCEGSVWLWQQRQGQAAKPFRAESSSNKFERIQSENLATASHTLKKHPATETSDWRKSENIEERPTDEAGYWCFIRKSFLLCWKSIAPQS